MNLQINSVSLKHLLVLLLILSPFLSKTQEIVEEIIPIDTSYITYKVIYRETIGDYFQLKKAVFAEDTSVVAIEKNYSNGHQNGLMRVYYPSGKIRLKAIYGNDKLQGEWTHYGEDGIIITKGIYNFGIKHGYWAYKSEKTYGRYNSKGLKHRKWIKKDINNQKHKAFYWNGKLKSGATIFEDNYKTHADTFFTTNNSTKQIDTLNSNSNEFPILDTQYVEVLKHIAQNYYLRKASKDYFRTSKKERGKFIDQYINLEKDVFKFNVVPYISGISIHEFLNSKKLIKPTIDSLLKASGKEINDKLNTFEVIENLSLTNYSTEKGSSMLVYLSTPIKNLIVVDLVEHSNTQSNTNFNEIYLNMDLKHMKILFLLNNENNIIEVEYQKITQ